MLYLLVVGVPSAARAVYAVVYREVTGVKWPRYFDGYPEAWADRTGGVERTPRPDAQPAAAACASSASSTRP